MDNEFGKYLKEKRESKGYTINQLALYSGLSAAQLSRIENGKRGAPKAENIKKISDALNIPYEEMMKVAGHFKPNVGGFNSNLGNINEKPTRYVSQEQLGVFSSRLKKELNRAGISEEDAAEDCNVTIDYIIELIEQPKRLPGATTLFKLATLVSGKKTEDKITPDYLGGFTDDPQGYSPLTPKPKELENVLEDDLMFHGTPLDEDAKEKILGFMQLMFADAKEKNRRKK